MSVRIGAPETVNGSELESVGSESVQRTKMSTMRSATSCAAGIVNLASVGATLKHGRLPAIPESTANIGDSKLLPRAMMVVSLALALTVFGSRAVRIGVSAVARNGNELADRAGTASHTYACTSTRLPTVSIRSSGMMNVADVRLSTVAGASRGMPELAIVNGADIGSAKLVPVMVTTTPAVPASAKSGVMSMSVGCASGGS